jgi:hypothetical protein
LGLGVDGDIKKEKLAHLAMGVSKFFCDPTTVLWLLISGSFLLIGAMSTAIPSLP